MGKKIIAYAALCAAALALPLAHVSAQEAGGAAYDAPQCAISLNILGIGQDAGIPQAGNFDDPAYQHVGQRHLASSLGLVDHESGKKWLFDATPDMREQSYLLNRIAPETNRVKAKRNLGLDGVFLTHGHIGHYTGLMFVGREASSADRLPVYATQRMGDFLRDNRPWSQLVALNNIDIKTIADGVPVDLGNGMMVTPLNVPHRDEYSDTVGFIIKTAEYSALYLPDIDNWQRWQSEFGHDIADIIAQVDYAFIDATFYDDKELGGRDISEIPHPRVTQSMALFADKPAEFRQKVHFIHINHSNKIRNRQSAEAQNVLGQGFNIAQMGQQICLEKLPVAVD